MTAFSLMVGASYGICKDVIDIITRVLATFLDFVSVFVRGINFTHSLATGTKLNEFISQLVTAVRETDQTKQAKAFTDALNMAPAYNSTARSQMFFSGGLFKPLAFN